jgi:hypothetical protein
LRSVAVLIALGGTAVAATATTTKEHGTAVSAADVPKQPFFGKAFVSTGGQNVMIAANTATVALTRVNVDNYYGQTGGATIQLSLYELGGNATTCDGSSGTRPIGFYDVRVGDVFADSIGSPIVLKPLADGTVWCLVAFVNIQGSPSTYFLPSLAVSGYVASGKLPPDAVTTSAPAATPPRSN